MLAASDVPSSVVDTGLRTSGGELLLIADDESVLYVVSGDDARVFVQPEQEVACA